MCPLIGTLQNIGTVGYTLTKLKEAGAVSPKTAKKLKELEKIGLKEKWLEIPGVKRTPDGRYYLECDGKHC